MKKIFLILCLLLLLTPETVLAHGANGGPSININGNPVQSYFLEDKSVYSAGLIIPNDKAPKSYLLSNEIKFEVDLSEAEGEQNISVNWDFGDGTKSEGLAVGHVYADSGSYFITVESKQDGEFLASEIILINIVSSEDYQLPNAMIAVNGKKAEADDFNILEIDLANSLKFDGAGSSSPDSRIVKYTWDFGDEKTEKGESVSHQYELPQAFATVLLRVEDENGLIGDAIVNVRNSGDNQPRAAGTHFLGLVIPALVVILIIAGGLFLFRKKK